MEYFEIIFGFAAMVLFAFVLPIVMYSIYSANKRAQAKTALAAAGSRRDAALAEELEQVSARLAVLEEIVTDSKYQLDNEIRRLESA